jgi:hypothetical protein
MAQPKNNLRFYANETADTWFFAVFVRYMCHHVVFNVKSVRAPATLDGG